MRLKNLPIIKQVRGAFWNYEYRKDLRENEKMDKKYGDCALETDDYKFIWGLKSYDDLCSGDCCLYTMNDIDIVYDKKHDKYNLDIETAFWFEDKNGECKYLLRLLDSFTKYMDDNGLDKNKPYEFWMSNLTTSMSADTIEDLYTNFNIFVRGYLEVNGYKGGES